ncbi:hypothetical protein ACJIZ3_007643 [Penstemon smallii]|uniref:Sister chromatid cohesion 1 protein 3 n=1 Tax=Penstemon smallii TaxID=265156 RepID=A0ABD3T7J5_9LAMI
MFYSHTFLARKGPLGTVWCAAHLQHKLKKSQYISTNIPSTVERIIDSEVPIALRMSAHLLLGVVRIYSKQVDYLREDCNVVLLTINRVFTAATVNLPEDATHAPFHSITLPQRFELDALDLDDYSKDWCEDTHLKSHEDITLTEQIPTGKDPYIVITLDENDLRNSSFTEDNSGSGAIMPMEEDLPFPEEEHVPAGFEDPGPSNKLDDNERIVGDSTPQKFPSVEIMRDARRDFHFNGSPILPDRAEPDKFLEELINKDKNAGTPVVKEAHVAEEVVLPDEGFPSSHNHQEQDSFGHINTPILFAHRSPEMELQATPPVAQPNIRKRKTKHQLYDDTTVLSNAHMKKALNDTRGLCRVKKNCPSTSLDVWKVNKRLRKDDAFFEPFITGTCAELQDIFKEDFISSKPHLFTTENEHQETTNTAQPPQPRHEDDMEIEVLRNNNERASEDRYMPSFSADVPISNEKSYSTPENSNFGLGSERVETTEGGETLPPFDMGGFTGHFDSEMETPNTFDRDGVNFEHTALSDIPELVTSAGDLGFLDQDDNSPAGSQRTPEFGFGSMNKGTPGLEALSSRTRAVAQYLKKQSPASPIAENLGDSTGDLHLNKILEGKPRKICARMFYETLVLKNLDLIDVHQEKPYDDVTLKVAF